MKKKIKHAKPAKTKIRKQKQPKSRYTCFRCAKGFPTRRGLKLHSRAHLQALRELTMLEQGHVPVETKLGAGFRGKNRIIVAEN